MHCARRWALGVLFSGGSRGVVLGDCWGPGAERLPRGGTIISVFGVIDGSLPDGTVTEARTRNAHQQARVGKARAEVSIWHQKNKNVDLHGGPPRDPPPQDPQGWARATNWRTPRGDLLGGPPEDHPGGSPGGYPGGIPLWTPKGGLPISSLRSGGQFMKACSAILQ